MLNLWHRTHKKSRETQLDWQGGPFDLERPLFIFHALTVDPICRINELEAFMKRDVRAGDPPIFMPVYAQETYRRIAVRRNWKKYHRCPVAEFQCATRVQLTGVD